MPGIAPIHPGVPKTPSSAPPAAPAATLASAAPERRIPSPQHADFPPGTRAGGKGGKTPRGAILLIGVALVLLAGAAAVALLWEAPRPISARLVVGQDETEQLELSCSDCPDGTTLRSGSAVAVFQNGKALLGPENPLQVGENQLRVSLERPGMGRNEEVELAVPVDYRIRGDLTGLDEDPPKLRISVEATPGTAVVLDGHALALDAVGRAVHEMDVASELEGPEDSVVFLERRVPYSVTPAGSVAHTGEVNLKLGLTPLRIDAPGRRIVIDREHFMLTGRTLKEGTVAVENRSITVDTAGQFSQLMKVDSEGETTITLRASAKGHGPRFARIQVKRVKSLESEASAFLQRAVREYDKIQRGPEAQAGVAAALEGRVVEARVENHVTFVVLDVPSGCNEAPCLARLVHGATVQLERDEHIAAFGEVTRAVDGPRTGRKIPEIFTAFLIKRPPQSKLRK